MAQIYYNKLRLALLTTIIRTYRGGSLTTHFANSLQEMWGERFDRAQFLKDCEVK